MSEEKDSRVRSLMVPDFALCTLTFLGKNKRRRPDIGSMVIRMLERRIC